MRDDGARIPDLAENKPGHEAEREQLETGLGEIGAVDAVETALADAIQKAAAAGRFDVLPGLVAELEARRKARAGTVDLSTERVRRGKR